jgi:hypothetical protein
MPAKSIGFRFGVGFRFRLGFSSGCLSSEFPPVVMFLNGEGSGQQALKGLLVECQVGPVRGHGISGREIVETDAIVFQTLFRLKPQSYPMQDEPEGEVRFQYKMSLERMAC